MSLHFFHSSDKCFSLEAKLNQLSDGGNYGVIIITIASDEIRLTISEAELRDFCEQHSLEYPALDESP